MAKPWAPGLTQAHTGYRVTGSSKALLTFSLCRALFSSPSTCRSFLATPMQGSSVRTPRWQATPKPEREQWERVGQWDGMGNQPQSLIYRHGPLGQTDCSVNEASVLRAQCQGGVWEVSPSDSIGELRHTYPHDPSLSSPAGLRPLHLSPMVWAPVRAPGLQWLGTYTQEWPAGLELLSKLACVYPLAPGSWFLTRPLS